MNEGRARSGPPSLDEAVAALRPRLLAHCYRLLGSATDAEDVVQIAIVRAWSARDQFSGRSSLATWLFAIATRCCLDELRGRPRRAVPAGLGVEDDTVGEPAWIEPFPTPEGAADRHESLSLAFVAVLQRLPPRQRAALVLADVLDWSAADIAETLDTTVPAVRSALFRARSTVAERSELGLAPPDVHALASRLVAAWEQGDADAMAALLAADATLSMPPERKVVHGRDAIVAFFVGTVWPSHRWKLVPVRANGTLAFATWVDGAAPHAVAVVHLDGEGLIASLVAFRFPHLVDRFAP